MRKRALYSLAILTTSLMLLLAITVILAGCGGAPATPSPTPTLTTTPTPTSPGTSGTEVRVTLSAQSISFNAQTITVPAGALVTLEFTNFESPFVFHDFALYESSAAANPIFVGEIIPGGQSATYQFMAPTTPGTYFFRCDVHPFVMTGDFIVVAAP